MHTQDTDGARAAHRHLRFHFRRGAEIFEVDAIIAPAATWRQMAESRDGHWQAKQLFHLVLALRLTLPPEITQVCDAGRIGRSVATGSNWD